MEVTKYTKRYRYFSLINQTTIVLPKNMFEKACAVYAAACGNPIFGKELKNARHLRSIMVEDIPVVSVPTTILQIKSLRYISISKVWILRALPEAISDAWSLQALHVTDCRNFVELPGSIGKLQKLRTLNLSGCKSLKRLPNSIGDCQMISSIDLYHCKKLTVLPNSIGKLQKLKTLKLSLCEELKCLPESIGDCQMISSIDLCNCWELKALPDSICRNEKLRVLRLGNTHIESLPSSFTMLRDLECLDLNKCREPVELPEGIGHLEKLQVLNLKDCEKLRGMPVGIGNLSGLQKLGLFVVGEGKKFARISELTHIGRNSEDLIIRGIAHVMEPDDAHKTCLKHKTNLQRLNLEWKRYHVGEVNTELEQAVLDGLELPPGIKELKIRGYSGTQYARWIQNEVGGGVQGLAYFQLLRVMNLCNFSNLKHLHGLVELPSLEELVLRAMPSLESISGGPFPALVKLVLYKLPSLEELWIVTERTISDGEEEGSCRNCTPYLGQVQVGNCITYFDITDCPKLKFKPYLPLSLQHWKLSGSSEQLLQSPDLCEGCTSSSSFSHLKRLRLPRMTGLGYGLESWQILSFYNTERPQGLASLTSLQSLDVFLSTICELPECLGELRSLQKLTIRSCHSLRSLPQSMGHLTSLQVLSVDWCHALQQLPECLGELCSLRTLYVGGLRNINSFPQSLRYLTSLRDLRIGGCDALHELPECLGDLRSLCKLYIIGLPRLTCFPKSLCRLTSLELLRITDCPGLTSLPQGMKSLSSLEKLSIFSCPGIKTLPEGIKGLTSLKELWIQGCPDLAVRCEREKGEDWHLISHIPVCLGILTASSDLGHLC